MIIFSQRRRGAEAESPAMGNQQTSPSLMKGWIATKGQDGVVETLGIPLTFFFSAALSTTPSSLRDATPSSMKGKLQRMKAESLIHTSVGQGTESRRPTKRGTKISRLKALHIAASPSPMMCKAYSLDSAVCPVRRAMPYASMCKGFALKTSLQRAESPIGNSVGQSPTNRMQKIFSPVRASANCRRPYRADLISATIRRAPPYAIAYRAFSPLREKNSREGGQNT